MTDGWADGWADGVTLVAFDADDTLWHSEDLFVDAHTNLAVALGLPRAELETRLNEVERGNVASYGYGAKSFALSALELALEVAADRPAVMAEAAAVILRDARAILHDPIRLLDGPVLFELLARLRSAGLRLAVITKGDYLVQSSKLDRSGLLPLLDRTAIVAEKNEAEYDRLFRSWDVPPEAVCMVGNSVGSDILPVLSLGGHAVHVPYQHVWAVDHAELPASPRLRTIDHLRELLPLLVRQKA